MKRAIRLTTVENVKEQNLIISLEIKDEFAVRFIVVLKTRLRNLSKEKHANAFKRNKNTRKKSPIPTLC